MPQRKLSYSASLISQGEHRFYSLTMPSDVLARTCFVSTRDDDPQRGFQRLLDKRRALEIAEYIDNGLGTIPTSIILSAQARSSFAYTRRTKTVDFVEVAKSFLVLDGQHRVYGFSLAKSALRVPVIIYTGLSRRDETRIFIDINTKQRPVPNELLLDIKSLAEYETDEEQQLRELFDLFAEDPHSPLLGMLSATSRRQGKISRVTFNAGVKPLLGLLSIMDPDEAYQTLAAYVAAHIECLHSMRARSSISKPTYFKAAMRTFPLVAQRVKDRHGQQYNVQNFLEVLEPALARMQTQKIRNPGRSVQALTESLSRALQTGFTL